jgi:HTH-type transcriptional repressor of NAD biosynthesis genes
VTAQFRHGLVVGKFSPLHRGHEFLITKARDACQQVTVLSYSKPELPRCNAQSRAAWLKHVAQATRVVVLDDVRLARMCRIRGLDQRAIPCNDATDDEQRDFVAWVCSKLLRIRVDAVFTSETYGDGFAAYLSSAFTRDGPGLVNVAHRMVDLHRRSYPVSATQVRAAPAQWIDSLDPYVFADLLPRVCILGGESSGKTTLAGALAQALGYVLIPEYGRTYWEQAGPELGLSDLERIAARQIELEVTAAQLVPTGLVCDTSPLTTLVYALLDHGRPTRQLVGLSRREYDLVVLCAPDFPFVQDGTRRDEPWRTAQHRLTLELLKRRGTSFITVCGPIHDRVSDVLTALKRLHT